MQSSLSVTPRGSRWSAGNGSVRVVHDDRASRRLPPHGVGGGFSPCRVSATVEENVHASLGDLVLKVAQPLALPEPGHWDIDTCHSSVAFTARHIGLAHVHGRFNSFMGAIWMGEQVEDCSMHVVIDAHSIDTAVKMRDDHLRSSDFLDVARFSTMEFYSDRFVHKNGNRWAISGGLTLHGVTRTVTLDTEYLGVAQGLGARPARLAALPPSCTATTSQSPGRICSRAASRPSGTES